MNIDFEKNTVAQTVRLWGVDFKLLKVQQWLGFLIIALGASMIWLGPSMSGYGALHAAWCVSSDPTLLVKLGDVVWMATQHCPYCYVGAAFVGNGFLTFVRTGKEPAKQ